MKRGISAATGQTADQLGQPTGTFFLHPNGELAVQVSLYILVNAALSCLPGRWDLGPDTGINSKTPAKHMVSATCKVKPHDAGNVPGNPTQCFMEDSSG